MLAEVLRLQGVLLLCQPSPDAAQATDCFQQAIRIARHQHARAWELRASLNLARLWLSQDKRHAATELLIPLYAWFTEGFDTTDLHEARRLLSTGHS